MVMATTFTPQYIGREFVRQYYTMLFKDPTQLHRFYMKHSLFTHASIPNRPVEPVTGQEAIHNKIMELKFRDCYSKIRSVDSQKTINDGVVVQVAGELSNQGMPLRKFTQTFVLEAEAPQRYYVLNDIFRYQDEEIEYEDQPDENAGDYYSTDENEVKDEQPAADYGQDAEEDMQQVSETVENFEAENPIAQSLTNGNHDHGDEEEAITDTGAPYTTEVKDIDARIESEAPVEDVSAQSYLDASSEEAKCLESSVQAEQEEASVEEPAEPAGPPQPVTWAALAKKNTPATSPPSVTPVSRPAPSKQQASPQTAPAPQRAARRREDVQKKENKDEGRRKFSGAPPDNHQIFIGNLPSNITENDVRDIFKEYGTIVEIRLNPKNFGFVAFDAPEPAEKILKREKAIVFGKTTINVEEKRASGSAVGRGGPRREFAGRSRNDSGPKNGVPGGRQGGQQGQQQSSRDRPRAGQVGQQKQRGGMNAGENKGENARGQRNRDRGNPVKR